MNSTSNASGFVSFSAAIASHALDRPEGLAFQVGDHAMSWAVLQARVERVAQGLLREGVRTGDRVAVIGLSSLAYIECFFGAIAARACIVPLPASASIEALEAMLHDSSVKLLFVDPDTGASIAEMAERLTQQRALRAITFGEGGADGEAYTRWRDLAADGASGPLPSGEPADPFNIIYSSGTTGVPKGIVHLHGMRQSQATRKGLGFSPASCSLLSTPMYSNTTIMPMLASVANGGSCVLMRKFDTARYLALAVEHRATHTMLVPVQYQRLLAHPSFADSDLSSLELSQTTGAPMDVVLKRDILARWPGRFLEVYGLTEGGVSCFLEPRLHPEKLHTVGKAGYGTEVFLIDEAGQPLPPGPDVTGEVVGRSPYMMAGYHCRPDADADIRWFDAQGGLYHRSGDIGRFDEDGFLTLLDRKKDVIISGGNNIYAADLEAVLGRHTDVLDSAVIGIPSAQWGETPLALVVPRPGASLDPVALCEWVNARVGRTQRLAAIEVRSELPRSALGKLSKKELRAPYWRPSIQRERLSYP
jgi:long-chain acyl-CoA synthetase